MSSDYAAGASAARYKIKRVFDKLGMRVYSSTYSCPPSDDDFAEAVHRQLDHGSKMSVAVFRWFQSQYSVLFPSSFVSKSERNPSTEQELFIALHDQSRTRTENRFFLKRDSEGNISVHKERVGQNLIEKLETLIVERDD